MESCRHLAVVVLLAAVPWPGPAAACQVCAPLVNLTGALAACYAQQVGTVLGNARLLGLSLAVFDLSDCPGAPDGGPVQPRSAFALPEPMVAGAGEVVPDLRFILDLPRAECLMRLVTAAPIEPDDLRVFDLSLDCAPAETADE